MELWPSSPARHSQVQIVLEYDGSSSSRGIVALRGGGEMCVVWIGDEVVRGEEVNAWGRQHAEQRIANDLQPPCAAALQLCNRHTSKKQNRKNSFKNLQGWNKLTSPRKFYKQHKAPPKAPSK